jgi:hypothetical protein
LPALVTFEHVEQRRAFYFARDDLRTRREQQAQNVIEPFIFCFA